MEETTKHSEGPKPEDIRRVYEAAYSLAPAARAFSRGTLNPLLSEETLMRAADTVIEKLERGEVELARESEKEGQRERPPENYNIIQNLPAYVFATYKNLLRNELRKKREDTVSDEQMATIGTGEDPLRILEAKIMMSQIVESLDPESRLIFDCLALGYSYKEISKKFEEQLGVSISENVLRVKYHRLTTRLKKLLT